MRLTNVEKLHEALRPAYNPAAHARASNAAHRHAKGARANCQTPQPRENVSSCRRV